MKEDYRFVKNFDTTNKLSSDSNELLFILNIKAICKQAFLSKKTNKSRLGAQ